MNIEEIFSNKYLFNPTPSTTNQYFWYLLIFFSVLVLMAIFLRLMKSWDKKIRAVQSNCFITCGILGLVYLFARHERLPWLASRAFLALDLLVLVIWILIITIWMTKYNKKLDSQKILEDRYKKYLPTKKK